MLYDPLRTALLVGCIFAVLVAALLLPAAGYEGHGPIGNPDDRVDDRSGVPPDDGRSDGSDPSTDDGGEGSSIDAGDGGQTAEENGDSPGTTSTPASSTETPSNSTETEAAPGDPDDVAAIVWGVLFVGGVGGSLIALWIGTDPRRVEDHPSDLPSGLHLRLHVLRLRLRRIPQLTMTATIGASRILPAILDGVARTGRGIAGGLGLLARDVGAGPVVGLTTVPASFAAAVRSFSGAPGVLSSVFGAATGDLASLTGGVSSLFSGIGTRIGRSRRRSQRAPSGTAVDDSPPATEPESTEITVEEAWRAMVEGLPVHRHHVRTPGEIARRAIDHGLPEEPVARLTETFCDVRYGGAPSTPQRITVATTSLERIERARRHDGGDIR